MWVLGAALLTLGGLIGGRWGTVAVVVAVLVVTGFVTVPLMTFVHEMGHAATAVALTQRPALIQIGEEPYRVRFAIGRIDVELSSGSHPAQCVPDPWVSISRREFFLITLAGPVASLLLAGCLGAGAAVCQEAPAPVFWSLAVGAAGCLVTALENLVPLRTMPRWWGGQAQDEGPSDGWILLHLLKEGLSNETLPRMQHQPISRMTDALARAITVAGDAAGAGPIGTQHLLAGLADDPATAGRVLHGCGFRPPPAGPPAGAAPAEVEFTPEARRVLWRAADLLTLRGDQNIDTEHVLLALIEEPGSSGVQALAQAGVDPAQVRQAALQALAPQHL